MGGDTASDGIPLLTRLLLVRATAHFDPSFPSDAHRTSAFPLSPNPGRSPVAATPPYTAAGALHVRPSLRIVAHYAQSESNEHATKPPPLRGATSTPEEEAEFFVSHPPLQQLLTSLATDRLREKVKLRQIQTAIASTAMKLARVSGDSSATPALAAGSPDARSFLSASITSAPSSTPQWSGRRVSATSVDDAQGQSRTGGSCGPPGQGILAAATATFAEDAAWRSLTAPYQSQLNPWSLMPVSDEGCYLSLPSPAYVHWCQVQAARCCSKGSADAGPMEPNVKGGPMPYNDVVHYASVNGGRSNSGCGEDMGYVHGYAFVLDGAVFAESGEQKEAATTDEGPLSDDDRRVSVLLWCVLSDAPVFNFMRSLTLEAVAAMSYVAQRTYHSFAASASFHGVTSGTGVRTDVYTRTLDNNLDEEVVRPLAAELILRGSVSSRTLPGESFTVALPLMCGSQCDASTRLHTSSMSGILTLRRPLDLLFPFADVPLAVLLLSFGEDALRVLLSLLLQEERVVVIGATPQHASACVVSLLGLIAPFTWVSPLVPYLPPHIAAQTGLLHTLLSAPYEVQQQNRRQGSTPALSRPAPYSNGGASQSSQHMQSAGFLLGSTAGIRPYLMFLSAFGVTEEDGGRVSRSGRSPRVWIADARTGAVAVCPTAPISKYLIADAKTRHASGTNGSNIDMDRSCTAHGGASAWTLPAHLDLRAAAPQVYSSSSSSGSSPNSYVLYNAVRNTLRAAMAFNVLGTAPLDVLPPFHDELCDVLRRVAPTEKRRQFRQALEALVQHTHIRVDNLASLAARLMRGLRQALQAPVASTDAMRFSSFSVDSIDSGSNDSNYSSDSDSGDEDELSKCDTILIDENASFRAVTEAVAQSHSLAFPDPSSSSCLAQFPTLSLRDTWQVQSGFLGYVVERLVGAYRRGITVTSGAASHRSSRRRFMQASVFLAPGLDQHYTLAETVARTHLFRQFECAVLEAENLGLYRVLSGCGLHINKSSSSSNETGGQCGVCHAMMKYVRPLAMFAILCDRARLQYPELFADVPGLDGVGTVYATLVKRFFINRRDPQTAISVPSAIRNIAGSGASSDPSRASVISSSSSGSYTSNSSGFRGFLVKAAKAMKLHSNNGTGGGGGGRGLPVLHIPASVACINSFVVAPFSARHVALESSLIATGDGNRPDGKPRRHHHHHLRGLHLHRHRGKRKGARRCPDEDMVNLQATPTRSQRQQWALQQQQQQHAAINIDFTLDDCTSVVRNPNVPGDVSGSLMSSFSTSTAAAAAAAAGGAAAGVLNNSVYVSGVGLDAELLTAVAHAGGARGGCDCNDATMRMLAEASLSICHALPFDVVHLFDAYEPLLAPVFAPFATSASGGSAAAVDVVGGMSASVGEADVTSPEAYMGVGLLLPSCINVWREGEMRAARVLQEQRQSPRQNQRGSPPLQVHSSQLPPQPVKVVGASTPLEAQLWSTPSSDPFFSSQRRTGCAAAAAGEMEAGGPLTTSWGTFTSGVPLGFPIDSSPPSLPINSNNFNNSSTHVMLSSIGWGKAAFAASPNASAALASTPAPALAAAVSSIQPAPHANAYPDAWENWGMQAPVVVNTPIPMTATSVATVTSASTRSPSNCANVGIREVVPPMPSAERPISIPAPGDVMDELFAGLPSYNNGGNANSSRSNTNSVVQQQQQQQPPRHPTLDDFF